MKTGRRQWLAALTVAAGVHAGAAFIMLSDGSGGAGGNGAGGFGGGIRVSLLPGTSGEPTPSTPAETDAMEATPETVEPPKPVPEPPPEEIVEDIPVEEPTIRPPEPSQMAQLPEAREPEPVPEPEPAPEPVPPPEPEPEPIPEPEPEPIPEPEPVEEEEVVAAIPEPLPPPAPTPPQPAMEPPPRPQVKPTPPPQPVQTATPQPAPAAPAAPEPSRRTAALNPAPTAPGPGDPSPTSATSGGGGGGGTPAGDGRRMDYATVLSAWLEQYKEYPRRAQSRRYEGIATLRFTVDRQGNVLSYRIDESSGHAALDRAVEEMIERAQPLPPMPEEMTTAQMEVVLPVAFRLE